MTKPRPQPDTPPRDLTRARAYLYGSDRPGADGRVATGSASGAVTRG